MNAARIKSLTPQAIKESFAKWAQVMEQLPDAARTSVVFYKFNPDKLRANGNMKDIENRFLEGRDSGSTPTALTWRSSAEDICEYDETWCELGRAVPGGEGGGVAKGEGALGPAWRVLVPVQAGPDNPDTALKCLLR
ncbi:hypothetical protein MRS44_005569 [Fusarium solani]|uniref:uncharacterized protein n=1 Tax=Fusarium solani TaxID=169388 RepID=UPI0032C3DF01|nr:hypothetical protein MRS44_005569 [Fusarium solani]